MFLIFEMSAVDIEDVQCELHVPRDPRSMNSCLAVAKTFCACIGAVHARILAIAFHLQRLKMSLGVSNNRMLQTNERLYLSSMT